MDCNAVDLKLRKKVGELFTKKHPSKGVVVEGFDGAIARVQFVQGRVREHREFLNKRAARRENIRRITKNMAYFSAAIIRGETLMSFDIERAKSNKAFLEVGVTMYKGGEFRSYNYQLPGVSMRSVFTFGDTEILEWDEIVKRLRAHADEAFAYVGHSLHIDFDHLKEGGVKLPTERHGARVGTYDTGFWSHLFGDDTMKLTDMCARFGIASPAPHCGGNDARYTMELALAMIAP